MIHYIAILGFTKHCPEDNQCQAFKLGQELSTEGFGVASDDLFGAAKFTFMGAKLWQGKTLAILKKSANHYDDKNCDIIEESNNQDLQHQRLADICCGAVVIGGDDDALHLAQTFLQQGKPVIAIKDSGGIASNELCQKRLGRQIEFYANIASAIKQSIKFWHTPALKISC